MHLALSHLFSRQLGAAAAALLLVSATVASSQTLSLANSSPVNVTPGGTFSFTLQVSSTNTSLTGLDYQLNASGPSLFELTARNVTGSVFDSVITGNNTLFLSGNPLALNPSELYDLGAFASTTQTAPFNAAFVATFTVHTLASAAPGSYTLGTTGTSASDDNFNTVSLGGTSLTVNVVPEPAAGWIFLGAAAIMLCATRLRRLIPRG